MDRPYDFRDFLQAIRSGTLQAALEVAEERAKK
jgi:hypothetical protein